MPYVVAIKMGVVVGVYAAVAVVTCMKTIPVLTLGVEYITEGVGLGVAKLRKKLGK